MGLSISRNKEQAWLGRPAEGAAELERCTMSGDVRRRPPSTEQSRGSRLTMLTARETEHCPLLEALDLPREFVADGRRFAQSSQDNLDLVLPVGGEALAIVTDWWRGFGSITGETRTSFTEPSGDRRNGAFAPKGSHGMGEHRALFAKFSEACAAAQGATSHAQPRDMLAQLGDRSARARQFKSLVGKYGNEKVMKTLTSYGAVPAATQRDLIRVSRPHRWGADIAAKEQVAALEA